MINWNRIVFLCSFLAVKLVTNVGAAESEVPAPPAVSPTAPPQPAPVRLLRQILIFDSMAEAQKSSVAPDSGLVVLSPSLSFLDRADLTKRLAVGQNQPITEQLLTAITQVIEVVLRKNDLPAATVVIPTQNIADGMVRIIVQLRKTALRRILIGNSVETAQQLSSSPPSGFVVLSPGLPVTDAAELTKRLTPGENRLIDDQLLAAIAQVIENFVRQHDYPIATALIPPQDFSDGAVKVALLPGKIRNIKMAGNRWFSESLLREKLRLEQGDTLRFSELDSAISWTNNNPFRAVRVRLEPVGNSGEADLVVAVQEALPLRLSLSYDNSGNDILGINRYTAAVSYANLWGLDHQISYQYITADRARNLQAHGFDYRIPLPWRHYVQLSASYLRARPELFAGEFKQDAETITSDLRYSVPLRTGTSPMEVYGLLSFKESNNNLLYGGESQFANKTDIFEATIGGSKVLRDNRGAWAFGGSVTGSPGGINSRNEDLVFQKARLGAKPGYLYGTLTIQRMLTLKHGWEFFARGVGRIADSNLISSEQLTIGGASSVRGFDENVFSGEQGYVFNNDLMAPVWKKPLHFLTKSGPPLETRFLLFYDAARVYYKHRFPKVNLFGQQTGWDDDHLRTLASAGLGLRMNIATKFTLTGDYGWQITQLASSQDHHAKGHLKLTLAF